MYTCYSIFVFLIIAKACTLQEYSENSKVHAVKGQLPLVGVLQCGNLTIATVGYTAFWKEIDLDTFESVNLITGQDFCNVLCAEM